MVLISEKYLGTYILHSSNLKVTVYYLVTVRFIVFIMISLDCDGSESAESGHCSVRARRGTSHSVKSSTPAVIDPTLSCPAVLTIEPQITPLQGDAYIASTISAAASGRP